MIKYSIFLLLGIRVLCTNMEYRMTLLEIGRKHEVDKERYKLLIVKGLSTFNAGGEKAVMGKY